MDLTMDEISLARAQLSPSASYRRDSISQLCFDDLEALWQIRWEGEADAGLVYPDIGRRNSGLLVTAIRVLMPSMDEVEEQFRPGPCEDFADMGIPKYPAEWYWNV